MKKKRVRDRGRVEKEKEKDEVKRRGGTDDRRMSYREQIERQKGQVI
jgi:hypothetical protein